MIKEKGINGVRLNPSHDLKARAKIATSQLVNRLNAFALSQKDPQTDQVVVMTDTQVRAALGLLRKTIPDLSQVSGSIDHRHSVEELPDATLLEIAAGRSAGTLAAAGGSQEPDQLH